jgi:CheY-like chemotaxis protein
VLVADDNHDAATALTLQLQLAGHDVRTAYDGLEALTVADAFRPEIVLLDLGMPKLNGYETARHLRARPWGESVRIVALTGWGQPQDRARSAEAGFDVHLVKPVTDGDLFRALLADPDRSSGLASQTR